MILPRSSSYRAPTERSRDLAEPTKALPLERLLNQGINYRNVADQFIWNSVADPQVGGASRTHPYPTILTPSDERFERQIKGQQRTSNHQWRVTLRLAEHQPL